MRLLHWLLLVSTTSAANVSSYFDIIRVTKQIFDRIEVLDLDPAESHIHPILWARHLADMDTIETGRALQVGLTPDCFVYTTWLSHAAQNLDKFSQKKENITRFKEENNRLCKDKLAVIMETDVNSRRETLFLVFDFFARKVRVQSAMNGKWETENGVSWSKLRNSSAEYFFTQNLENGYTFKKLFIGGGELYAYAKHRAIARLFRVKIFLSENYELRPYLVEEKSLKLDTRIVGAIEELDIVPVSNMYINHKKESKCPLDFMSNINKSLPIADHLLELCINQSKRFTLAELENTNLFYKNHPEYRGFVAKNDLFTGRDNGFLIVPKRTVNSIAVPLLSLQSNTLIGVTFNETIGYNYTWIGDNYRLRFKGGTGKFPDKITVFSVDIGSNKTICNRSLDYNETDSIKDLTIPLLNCWSKFMECIDHLTRNTQMAETEMDEICRNKSVIISKLCEKFDLNILKNETFFYEEHIKPWTDLLRVNGKHQCALPNPLLRILPRKLLNEERFHTRMNTPHVKYKQRRQKLRSNGYFSRVTLIFGGLFIAISLLFSIETCLTWRKVRRLKKLLQVDGLIKRKKAWEKDMGKRKK